MRRFILFRDTRYRVRALVVAVFALSAMSCASPPRNDDPSQLVIVAPGVSLQLPHRPGVGRRIEAAQSVRIRRQGTVFAFETRISISDGRFRIAALDLAGRRALTLDWTERGVEIDAAPWLPEAFRPRNLLADMVMMFWPPDDVRAALKGNDVRFEADSGHRSIKSEGKQIVRISFHPPRETRWTGITTYDNIGLGYSLDVRSFEVKP